ncbi:MAG: TRAP transporter small permease [Elusimicrobiota bacterium]|jgi:TRAP-type C4-dicarboxylate transport system permease small subunit|nr:TRAP transporter small permease [Elusimicrobiota bacterium]
MTTILVKIWDYFEEGCLVLFFAFMTIMNFANVLSRYAFNMSISATDELLICVFVWISMFGAATAYKRGSHFAMGLIAENVSPKTRAYMGLFGTICSLIIVSVLFYYSLGMIEMQMMTGQTTPALGMPAYIQGLSIPVGSVVIAIRVIQSGVADFKKYFLKAKSAADKGR